MQNTSVRTTTATPRPSRPSAGSRRKPKRRTQEERSAATRRRLIDAAVECLSELGYLEATVEVVAKRAGVSRGAVQHHFGSRNDLLVAVVDDFGLALAEPPAVGRDLPVAARVDAAIERTWELVRRPHFIAVVQVWLATRNTPEVVHVTGKKIAQFERELDQRWQDLFSDIKVPPEQIAVTRHLVLAALRGLALRTLYRKGRATWTKEITALKKMVITALS
jgi:AcrR family transcriptional regulator